MKYTDELSRIAEEHGGTLFPRDVVNAARDPQSILHGAFDWNDTVAAEKWRLEQARRLIRVQVVQLPNRNTPIQAFVSLSTSRTDEGGYMPIRTVMGNARMLERMKADAVRELEIFSAKYREISELQPVIEAADNFIEEEKKHGR